MKNSDQRAGNAESNIRIDQKLIEEGIDQLASEIKVLESWLEELEAADDKNSEVSAARKSYNDMLRSRREMLSALNQHAKTGADRSKA